MTTGHTTPTQMRLGDVTLAELDAIAAHHAAETGARVTRTDAVRIAARREAQRVRALARKGAKKNSENSSG